MRRRLTDSLFTECFMRHLLLLLVVLASLLVGRSALAADLLDTG